LQYFHAGVEYGIAESLAKIGQILQRREFNAREY